MMISGEVSLGSSSHPSSGPLHSRNETEAAPEKRKPTKTGAVRTSNKPELSGRHQGSHHPRSPRCCTPRCRHPRRATRGLRSRCQSRKRSLPRMTNRSRAHTRCIHRSARRVRRHTLPRSRSSRCRRGRSHRGYRHHRSLRCRRTRDRYRCRRRTRRNRSPRWRRCRRRPRPGRNSENHRKFTTVRAGEEICERGPLAHHLHLPRPFLAALLWLW